MPNDGESQTGFELHPEGSLEVRPPVWPMIPGVVTAALVLEFVCSWLRRGTLPRAGLVVLAASLLFVAVMVCGFVVRAVPGSRRATTPVVRAACLTALWIPAWVLFIETWSLLMLLAGCLCLASLGIFLKRCDVEVAMPSSGEPQRPAGMPFQFEPGVFRRMILPSLLLALLVEASVILVAARWFTVASIACGMSVAVFCWRAASKVRAGAERRPILSNPRQVMIVAAAFVFTVIALVPYLRIAPFKGGLASLLHKPIPQSAAPPKDQTASSSDGYTGIILLPLSEEHKKIIAPLKRDLIPSFSVKIARPLEIPFDGAYWYFKAPDKQPRPTAHVVRGSSTKALIQSSDRYPLLMEAHQKLDTPIDLGCCGAMELVVQNADRREGAIALELWVRKRAATAKAEAATRRAGVAPVVHYLGTVAIPSSELPLSMRSAARSRLPEERLKFLIPAAMDGVLFDEITVVVRPAAQRARIGAQLAIRKFVLEP